MNYGETGHKLGAPMAIGSPSDRVREIRKELEGIAKRAYLTVVLLGKEAGGLSERRQIAQVLERNGLNVLIPEDDLPREVSPSLAEYEMLTQGDADLIFLNVDSWGTSAEFGEYHGAPAVARKLRVLVRGRYHPLYGSETSYLTDLYMTHLAVFGHVYSYDNEDTESPQSSQSVVVRLAQRYSEVKRIKPNLTS